MFGVIELFSVLLFSYVLIGMLSGEVPLKGFISAFAGLTFATIGMVPMTGSSRFTMGILELQDGLSFVPLLIGLFALSEILLQCERVGEKGQKYITDIKKSESRVSWVIFRRCIRPIIQGTFIGFFIGIIPALGQPVAALLSYGIAKETSSKPEEFGKGSVEGVAASEAGNNAVDGPTLIPLLTFGIPGDIITAVMLGAFVAQGLRPGPGLMRDYGVQIYGILFSMTIANFVLLLVGLSLLPAFAKVIRIPKGVLLPIVLSLCVVGSYAVNNSVFDLWVMLAFGVIGYFMRKAEIPVAPFVIAFLLGARTEMTFSQALMISQGNPLNFLDKPIATGFLIAAAVVTLFLSLKSLRRRRAKKRVNAS